MFLRSLYATVEPPYLYHGNGHLREWFFKWKGHDLSPLKYIKQCTILTFDK